jgi:vitamin B12 transporter
MTRLSLLLLGTALAGMPVLAQDETFALDEITVSANRAETELSRAGSSVAVVEEEELEKAGGQPVAAYLATLPGVSLSTQGPIGNGAALRVRGADGRYLAVFVDGIRVSDPSAVTTSFDFGSLLTSDVGRIEVLRGSQSALYGGSAVGGVINIETKRPVEDGTRQTVSVEGGSYGTAALNYGMVRKTGALETTLNATMLATDGYSAASSGSEADGAEIARLSFGARYQASDSLAVGGSAFIQRTRQDYDGFDPLTFLPADAANVQRRRETGARAYAELTAGNTEHEFDVTAYDIDRAYDDAFGGSAFAGRRLGFSWTATTTVNDALTLVYGADTTTDEAIYTNLPGGSTDTTVSGAFAQAIWAAGADLDISATARVDNHSAFGTFGTGRVALAYRPSDDLTLRAAVARGFRAPSIDELYGDYSAFGFVGNPNLTPEESTSYEIGAEYAGADGLSLSVTAFRLEIDNLIVTNSTFSSLENQPGKSLRQGIEVGAAAQITDHVRATAAYTYTETERPDGTRLGLVPRHDLTLGVEADVTDRLTAGLTIKHQADRLDDFAAVAMPDFTVVNASASYDLGNDSEIVLRAENLFDETYELSNGYATAGRSAYVGFRKSF